MHIVVLLILVIFSSGDIREGRGYFADLKACEAAKADAQKVAVAVGAELYDVKCVEMAPGKPA
jgi:hypothetical protein